MRDIFKSNVSSDVRIINSSKQNLTAIKADITEIIDAQSKSEDDVLLLLKANVTDIADRYSKTVDDALLLLKTDKSDQVEAYTKKEDVTLLQLKADKSELSNYVTLGTSQTIIANKTFNYACRFENSIDGMSTITGSSFIKSRTNNTVVLLGAAGTKLISEFTTTIGDSLLYEEKQQQPTNEDCITLGAVKSEFFSSIYSGSINDNLTATQFIKLEDTDQQTFNANVNATGFVKTGKDDTSVLLAGGGDRLLSSFGWMEDLTSTAFSGNYNAGTFNPDYLVQDDVVIATYILFPNHTVNKGGYVSITHSTGLITLKSTIIKYIQCASASWVK
ncbi:MAG: hypothetical protein EZS28_014931 [Streblomastix strix]|uniref:Uncharacterized protein n=1 Tax=Streblomastix strix TaxID=222440 RepID=A0A5J4W3Y5_9EUKA|nr:MAG: hypothetical protein EZS28_014931 [Streblomastix strix]